MKRIRESKILVYGVLIGIFGNLLANVLDSLVKQNGIYHPVYIILLVIIFVGIILLVLKEWFEIKIRIFKMNSIINRYKRLKG